MVKFINEKEKENTVSVFPTVPCLVNKNNVHEQQNKNIKKDEKKSHFLKHVISPHYKG